MGFVKFNNSNKRTALLSQTMFKPLADAKTQVQSSAQLSRLQTQTLSLILMVIVQLICSLNLTMEPTITSKFGIESDLNSVSLTLN
jgi:hypothetical protein